MKNIKYFNSFILEEKSNIEVIKNVQLSLKKLGYNIGVSGENKDGVDGILGNSTINSLIDYQKKYIIPKLPSYKANGKIDDITIKYLQEQPEKPTTSWLGEIMKDLENKILDSIMSPIKNLIKKSGKLLPLHIRGLAYFILGRTGEFNEDELTIEEQKMLYIYALESLPKGKFTYPFFKSKTNDILPTAISIEAMKLEKAKIKNSKFEEIKNLIAPNIAGQFVYFLGQTGDKSIIKNGDVITITDTYDYNEGLTTNLIGLCKGLAETIAMFAVGEAGMYNVIRKAVALRHTTGYKGYKVKFTLKKPLQ